MTFITNLEQETRIRFMLEAHLIFFLTWKKIASII